MKKYTTKSMKDNQIDLKNVLKGAEETTKKVHFNLNFPFTTKASVAQAIGFDEWHLKI